MAETPTNGNGHAKWQNLSAFMLNMASKQFGITVIAFVFEAGVIYLGCNLPSNIAIESYYTLVGVAHNFLIPVVFFWFKNDQENKKLTTKEGASNGSN